MKYVPMCLQGTNKDNRPFTIYSFICLSTYKYGVKDQCSPETFFLRGGFCIVFLYIWCDSLDQGSARHKASA